jgi:hypothetical protein
MDGWMDGRRRENERAMRAKGETQHTGLAAGAPAFVRVAERGEHGGGGGHHVEKHLPRRKYQGRGSEEPRAENIMDRVLVVTPASPPPLPPPPSWPSPLVSGMPRRNPCSDGGAAGAHAQRRWASQSPSKKGLAPHSDFGTSVRFDTSPSDRLRVGKPAIAFP